MTPISGLGGVFIYSDDAPALAAWYSQHLGLAFEEYSPGKIYGLTFSGRSDRDPEVRVNTVFSIFQSEAKLGNTRCEFRMNFRIQDANALRQHLEQSGIICEPAEVSDYGSFFWATDPDGNRLEFWEPGDTSGS